MSTTSTLVPAQLHSQVGDIFLLESCLHVCLHPYCDSSVRNVDLLVAFSEYSGFAAGCVCEISIRFKEQNLHFDLLILILLKFVNSCFQISKLFEDSMLK